MAKNASAQEGGKSLQDIAAMLVQNAEQPVETDEQEEEVPTGGENEDDDALEAVIDEPEDEVEADASEEEGDDEQEDEQPDDAEDAESDYFDISDDDVLTVTVDGEEREVSIGELKKAHSLGGATEKRLQEATELRKTALAERTQMLEKLAAEEQALTEALSSMDDDVFTPVIPQPTAELRRSNPEQYLRHKEAYDADQQRIATAKQAVQERIAKIKETRTKRLNEYSQQAGQIILQEIPELADEKKAPFVLQSLAETAKAYGYTDQEIQQALDPRMFMLVRDAMRFRQMTDKTRERPTPVNREAQQQKKVRRLRSGNTSAKTRARQSDKQRKAMTERAKQTGKVADVAATLIVPKG